MNAIPEKKVARLAAHSSDSSPQIRRAISLRSRQTLRSLRTEDDTKAERAPITSRGRPIRDVPQNGLTSSAPIERPKKNRKKKLRKRFSLSIRSEKTTQEDIANLQREVKECNGAKISIGEDVAFSHKEHVGKDDANQFLLRLLKLREERYLEMHQEIRATITASYVHLRPPNHMAQQFLSIVSEGKPSEVSFRRRNKKAPMQNSTKACKFWIELVPQRVPPSKELTISPRKPKSNSNNKEKRKKKGSKIKKKKRRQSADKSDSTKNESPLKRRFEEIVYFPENLEHCGETNVEPLSPASSFLPKGAPDYVFFVFANEQKTAASQVLAVIPLTDVKITPISPVEFSISYVNRLPNSHCFQFRTPELMTTWLKTLALATQMQIHNPFTLTRSRSASITHGLSMIKDSFSTPRFMRKSSKDNGLQMFGQRSDESDQYYKYVCWDVEELKSEGAGAFTDRLQLQEVYMNDQDPHSDPVRQGWRLLGGTLNDLVCWCLLSSERGDKPNIDVAALVQQYEDGVLLERIDSVFDTLRAKLIPQNASKSSKRKSFFRATSIGQELTHTAEVIKEDQISAILHLERRLFNFLFQWIQLRVQMNDGDPSRDQYSAHLRLAYHCGQEKVEELKTFLQSSSSEEPLSPGRVINPCDLPVSIAELPPLLSHKADVLMEQLTVLEIDFYSQLRMNEFLNLRWEKEPQNAPAIQHLIQHYNHTGHWVATEIMQAGSPKMQAKMFAKFVRIAQRLLEIRNYATCAQILSGVSHRAVQRLKKLSKQLDWKTVERYESLNELFDPVSGYSNYRKKLSHEAPMIPFLAVHLRTMTLIEEGNPRTLGDDPEVISFARMVMYTESLAQLRLNDSSMVDYEFEPQPDILQQIEQVFVMTEEELFAKSEELEPLRGGLAAPRVEVEAPPSPEDLSQEEDEDESSES